MTTKRRRILGGPEESFLREASSSKFALELWVPLLFGIIIVSTGYLFDDIDDTTVNPHLIDFTAFAGAFVTFAFLGLRLQANFLNNLITWVAAGFVGAIVPNLLILLLEGKLSDFYLEQLPLGLLSYSLNIALCAIGLSGIRVSLNRARSLRQSLAQLETNRSKLESQIAQMRGDIRESVDSELRRVKDLLSQASPDGKLLGEAIMKAIDEVIRPLSHRLAGFGLKVSQPEVGPIAEALSFRKGVELSRLSGPILYLAFFLVFFLPATLVLGGPNALLATLPLLAVMVSLLFLIRWKATNLYVHRGLGMALLALLAAAFIPLTILLLGSELGLGIGIGFVNDSLVVSGLLALISKRVDVVNELKITNLKSQQLVQKLGQEVWVTRTKLAKAIHGAVQAKFLAIALRLQSSPNPTDGAIEFALEEVAGASDLVAKSLESDQLSFRQHINDYRDVWDGVVTVQLELEPKDFDLIDSYPLTRTCAVEVIGEAIANAAKHSSSSFVTVSIKEKNSQALVLAIASSGELHAADSQPGYGSQVLDEVTAHWSIQGSSGRVLLEAVLPLNK
jgi:signal transduction histidine kinase